jgi:hypothetical protein
MITLMLLELCESCFASTAPTLGDPKGCRPSAPKVRIGQKRHASATLRRRGERQFRRDASEARCDRGGVANWFGAEGVARTVALVLSKGHRNTWLRRTCKGAPYEAERRGAACKGGLAVRRHAGGL